MAEVSSQELHTNTRGLLGRVAAGEAITVTVDGRPVAVLQPVVGRPRWLGRDEFVRLIVPHGADASLATELTALVPDTTDDLPRS